MQVNLKSLQYPGSMPVQSTQDGIVEKIFSILFMSIMIPTPLIYVSMTTSSY